MSTRPLVIGPNPALGTADGHLAATLGSAKQTLYAEHRRRHTDQWRIANAEDFCARMEVDPQTGKWLAEDHP
jgi:hypothetical protein